MSAEAKRRELLRYRIAWVLANYPHYSRVELYATCCLGIEREEFDSIVEELVKNLDFLQRVD